MKCVMRFLIQLSIGLSILFVSVCSVSAQKPANRASDVKDKAAAVERAIPAGNVRPVSEFPPIPGPFFRGSGYYLNWLCWVPVLALLMLWTWSSHWVDGDSRSLKERSEFWNSVILGCGVTGFLLLVCIPQFLLGWLALMVCYCVPLGLYIKERNDRVPASAKVMTPAHIQNVLIRKLAQIGIPIGSMKTLESAIGPPITFIGRTTTGHIDESRSRRVENSKGYLAAKGLVYAAILRRGTDVHLEPKEGELSVRLRIDGIMYPTEPFDRAVGEMVLNIFKVLGTMDITEKRRPQDGSFSAEIKGRKIDFRVATQGTRFGEKLSLRILDQANAITTLPGLGLRKQLQEKLRSMIHLPHGMLLCCGPTGAGKTTTLHAALREIDARQKNIITIEDPIEYKMDNVNQIEINTKAGQTFVNSLRSILRQDPDVVMVGEIRDGETADIACQAANTGHMVFSTLHANDAITALYRLLELGVEPFMVSNSISAILGQRLARRLCLECREAYRVDPALLKKLRLPPEKVDKLYRQPKNPQQVCTACGGLGFSGRIGVFELLMINDRMRDMIREKAPLSSFKAEARKNGMLYMKEEGLRLIARGVTSLDELQRVVK